MAAAVYEENAHKMFEQMSLWDNAATAVEQTMFQATVSSKVTAHDVSHGMPCKDVIWDEELHGLNLQMPRTPTPSESATQKVLNGMPDEVAWDEDMSSNLIVHDGLLQQLALGEDMMTSVTVGNKGTTSELYGLSSSSSPGISEGISTCVVWQSLATHCASHVFKEMPNQKCARHMVGEMPDMEVVWDDESQHEFYSHDLLQQFALGIGDKMQCRQMDFEASVFSNYDDPKVFNINPCSDYDAPKVCHTNPWSDVVWDDDECKIMRPIVELDVNVKLPMERAYLDHENMIFDADLSQFFDSGVVDAVHMFDHMLAEGAERELHRSCPMDADNMLFPVNGLLIFLGRGITNVSQVLKVTPAGRFDNFDPTESEKGLDLSWMSDFSTGDKAKQHNNCSSTILNLTENQQYAVVPIADSKTVVCSKTFRKYTGLLQIFAVVSTDIQLRNLCCISNGSLTGIVLVHFIMIIC